MRIVARKHADGRVEFGLQQRNSDNTWADRQLPARRFFPTTATVGRWLNSSPLSTAGGGAGGGGTFTAVSVSGLVACGLRDDGTVTCWGDLGDDFEQPAGRYSAIDRLCGLRTDGSINCWEDTSWVEGAGESSTEDGIRYLDPHAWRDDPGPFTALANGCGLRADGTLAETSACHAPQHGVSVRALNDEGTPGPPSWVDAGTFKPPAGRFSAITGDSDFMCGLRTDSTIDCWGAHRSYAYGGEILADVVNMSELVPEGRFGAVDVGGRAACAVRSDGSIACWGEYWDCGGDHCWPGRIGNPSVQGRFAEVAVAGIGACGIRTDGTIECWRFQTDFFDDSLVEDAPGGRFSAIDVSGYACALRSEGAIACWGERNRRYWENEGVPEPAGVTHVGA